jgi:hypothetical protein
VTVRAVLVLALLLVAAGCSVEKKGPSFEPVSNPTRVSGTLAGKNDHRPVDGPLLLVVSVGEGREETVVVPSLFTAEPPSTATLALQQKADAVQVGDRLTATGTRNAEGQLVAEVLEIHEP